MARQIPIPEVERPFRRVSHREEAGHTSVVVPLDGSEHAAEALPVARALARLLGGMLHIVHAGPEDAQSPELTRRLRLSPRALRGAVVDRVPVLDPRTTLDYAVDRESAVIVASIGGGGEAPDGIGGFADGLIRESAVPLVFVPVGYDGRGRRLRTILLPHDGTPTTAAAFGPAVALAESSDAELIVLHAAEAKSAQPSEPGTYGGPQYVDQPQHEWPAWAHEFLERLGCIGCIPSGVHVRLLLESGDPGSRILKVAKTHDVDAIVLAWKGHWEPERARTVRRVLTEAPCPVVLLRTER